MPNRNPCTRSCCAERYGSVHLRVLPRAKCPGAVWEVDSEELAEAATTRDRRREESGEPRKPETKTTAPKGRSPKHCHAEAH